MKATSIAIACTALVASQVIQAAPIPYIRVIPPRPVKTLPPGVLITPHHILTVEPSTKLWTATPRRPLYDSAVQRQLLEGSTVEVQSTLVEPDWLVKHRTSLKTMCLIDPSSAVLCAP